MNETEYTLTPEATRRRPSDFLVGVLCGAAVGAAVGLLVAAKPGAELRADIARSADQLRRKANDSYDRASRAFNDIVARGRRAAREGRRAFDDARDRVSAEASAAAREVENHF